MPRCIKGVFTAHGGPKPSKDTVCGVILHHHAILITTIFLCTKSFYATLSTHMQTDPGLSSGVCMRWQSALPVKSSAPTSFPDGLGVSTAPFAHMKFPTSFQLLRSPAATLTKYVVTDEVKIVLNRIPH